MAHDLHHEGGLAARTAKGVLERTELDEGHAERPHVRLLVVRLAGAQLGREVARGANQGGGKVGAAGEQARDAKVANFDSVVGAEENVVWLDVAVHHAMLVDFVQPEQQLESVPPHCLLGNRPL